MTPSGHPISRNLICGIASAWGGDCARVTITTTTAVIAARTPRTISRAGGDHGPQRQLLSQEQQHPRTETVVSPSFKGLAACGVRVTKAHRAVGSLASISDEVRLPQPRCPDQLVAL